MPLDLFWLPRLTPWEQGYCRLNNGKHKLVQMFTEALQVAMPDVPNFFHKALAVILQNSNIYTSEESYRRALSSDTIFQLHIQLYAEVTFILMFTHTNFH